MQKYTELTDYTKIVHVTASHCCVCRRTLTDAESVEHGIGPICSKRFYNPLFIPSTRQVATAMGSLAISDLPENVIDAIIAKKANARKACNILVYWASAHYDDRDMIFKCSAVIRDFGYTELADKLEEDRTKVSLRIIDQNIIVSMSIRKWDAEKDFRLIPGAQQLSKAGHKYRWSFPIDQKANVETVIGYYYGKQLAFMEDGFFNNQGSTVYMVPARTWQDLVALQKDQNSPVLKVVHIVDPDPLSKTFEFLSPYNGDWLSAMKETIPYSSRKWNRNNKSWVFKRKYIDEVRDLAKTHYGVQV